MLNEKAYKYSTRDSTEFTVESGSGSDNGLSIFELTMTNNSDYTAEITAPFCITIPDGENAPFDRIALGSGELSSGATEIMKVIAFGGHARISMNATESNVEVTGGVSYLGYGMWHITGDGTIVIAEVERR